MLALGKHLSHVPAKEKMMPARNESNGQYTETYPLEAFLYSLRQLGGEVGTKEVQEQVGCEYRTAIAKLHELAEKGEINSRKVGNAYLWRLNESGGGDPSPSTDGPLQEGENGLDDRPDEVAPQNGPYDPMKEWE